LAKVAIFPLMSS